LKAVQRFYHIIGCENVLNLIHSERKEAKKMISTFEEKEKFADAPFLLMLFLSISIPSSLRFC